jgi:photosystem II stability/assembly factor-like uncharacterized protein
MTRLSSSLILIAGLTGCGTRSSPATDLASLPDLLPSYADAVRAGRWTPLTNGPKAPTGKKEDDLFPTSAMRAFAVSGPASSIYKTEDGGQTWNMMMNKPGTYFRSILFADDQHGFASNLGVGAGFGNVTDTTPLYETKDGGGTWAPVTNISGTVPPGICNQSRIDATHLVAVGRVQGPAYLMTSSDAGGSWTSIDLNAQLVMLIDAHFTSPTEGIVVGMGTAGSCTILHTSDGGQSFASVFTSQTPTSVCWKISFPSDQVGYVSVQDALTGPGTFAKTTDGGKTWTEKPLPLMDDAYHSIGIGFITDEIGWVSSELASQPTYRTFDGGETWEVDPVLTSPINRFRFVDAHTAYAIGGQIWKLVY